MIMGEIKKAGIRRLKNKRIKKSDRSFWQRRFLNLASGEFSVVVRFVISFLQSSARRERVRHTKAQIKRSKIPITVTPIIKKTTYILPISWSRVNANAPAKRMA
jgi:hypothetical protein